MTKISTTQTVTKSKISNCDKTKKHKLQQNSITQIATKLKTKMMSKLKKNRNCDKTQLLKLDKTQHFKL